MLNQTSYKRVKGFEHFLRLGFYLLYEAVVGFNELNSVSIAINLAFCKDFSISGYKSEKFSTVTSRIVQVVFEVSVSSYHRDIGTTTSPAAVICCLFKAVLKIR